METTTATSQRSPEEIEDIILRKIFLVTLIDSMGNDTGVVYLDMTAAEILRQGVGLRLSRDLMERVLVDRLSGNFTSAEPPFQYLIGIYRRAHEEGMKITNMKDESVGAQVELVVNQAKKLAVSYCRSHLSNPDMFPDSERSKSNVSPLLPLILSEVSTSIDGFDGISAVASSPPGFLDELFRDSDYDSMEPILKQLYEDLRGIVLKCSALGNFQQPLRALMYLISFPVGAKALVNHPWWIPKGALLNGRVIEMTSILGPFFHVSALPDQSIFKGQPDVGQQCFSEPSTRRPADLLSSFSTIKTVMNNLYDDLAEVLKSLLKNTSTRENVLQYIAEVINKNSSRAHIQVDSISSASSGMFVNLSAVMLRLCELFLDPYSTKKDKIDPKYIFCSSRLDFKELTALHASSEEVSEWINKNNTNNGNCGENRLLDSQATSSSGLLQNNNAFPSQCESTRDSFICECFFMTARVLNLGLLKAFSDFKHLVQDISRCEDSLATLKTMQEQAPLPRLAQEIARLKKEIETFTQEKLCYEAQILRDGGLLRQSLSFYQIMVVWLVGCIGGFRLPLPQTCPTEFACMPEHFVEDVMELLIFASRIPRALDGVKLDDFMNFIIMFMASPEYIRNPYLRAKMVEVLNCWMPHRSGTSSVTSLLFEGNQLSVQHLVRNLLKLYVGIEFTGSHTQFFDKFNMRHNIAELLEYLWQVPVHQNAWKQIAKEKEKSAYLNFLNFLINDSIFLLDGSLNKILELKEMEAEMSNTVEWEQRAERERQERTRLFHSLENIIRIDMKLAMEDVNILAFTTEQITDPFLLPEMVERVAGMLNYFLLQLVGPQRKSLSLKDPEKYEFRPKQLLKQIVNIYLHLARGDHENIFQSAITKDGQSYNDQLFMEAANVLRRIGEDSGIVQAFDDLRKKAKAAASEAMDAEAILGDNPDAFHDPIQTMIITKQYRCIHSASCVCTKGHLSEDVIFLILQHLNWNPKIIATLSCVCKWFDDLVKRVLWKEFCRTRAPKMMQDLQSSGSHSVDGNWSVLGKLLIYCSGCKKDGLFNKIHIPGHFAYRTRFSRTSGKSFLLPNCRTDVLYVSDPCEHLDQGEEGDVGFFRGVFKSFATSKVRKMLIRRGAKFHPTEFCPYCKGKLWSMLQAKMIPQSASCRLGAYEDCIEYYVCLNGHVLGICTLLPLSDSEEASEFD